MKNQENHPLLGNRVPVDWEKFHKMDETIGKLGGTLHFTIEKYPDGWTAECKEFAGIMTGGLNSQPSLDEIEFNVREAIHSAFGIETVPVSVSKKPEPSVRISHPADPSTFYLGIKAGMTKTVF